MQENDFLIYRFGVNDFSVLFSFYSALRLIRCAIVEKSIVQCILGRHFWILSDHKDHWLLVASLYNMHYSLVKATRVYVCRIGSQWLLNCIPGSMFQDGKHFPAVTTFFMQMYPTAQPDELKDPFINSTNNVPKQFPTRFYLTLIKEHKRVIKRHNRGVDNIFIQVNWQFSPV